MKKLLFIFLTGIATLNFSQNNFMISKISQLKDIHGIQLKNELFNNKYTLICNIYEESSVNVDVPYFKEVQKIYRNAFFNTIENRGLTILIFIHFSTNNYHQYTILKDMLVIPVNTDNNLKLIKNLPDLLDHNNVLVSSREEIVGFDFKPKSIRLDLTNYLKRE